MTSPDPFGHIANRQRAINETAKRNDQRRRREAQVNEEYDRAAQRLHDLHAGIIGGLLAHHNEDAAARQVSRYLESHLGLEAERAEALGRAR